MGGSMIRLLILLACFFVWPGNAKATLLDINVSISAQAMSFVDPFSRETVVWPVSTARRGKVTPTGTYQPYLMREMHYSSLYNNAPMPFSIFYSGHYAIHGTNKTEKLGSPASSGCVRLHPDNAKRLFQLVEQLGSDKTFITISN